MTILVDFDDVLNNLCETWVQILDEKYNLSVSINDIKEWDMKKAFPTLTAEEIYAPLSTQELWNKVKPREYASECLQKLIKAGHEIYITTATHPTILAMKYEFIQKYYPFIDSKYIITTYNKQMIKGDILIDDAPHNLIGGDYKGLLFNQPHNKSFKETIEDNIFRVNNWKEIEKEFEL